MQFPFPLQLFTREQLNVPQLLPVYPELQVQVLGPNLIFNFGFKKKKRKREEKIYQNKFLDHYN